MDDATDKKDDSRRTGYAWTKTSTAQFRFPGELDADIKVSQTHWEQSINNAAWHVKFNEFNDDICPGGELNWHVHQYPVSETASNILDRSRQQTQIESFNAENAQIESFNAETAQIESFNAQTALITSFAPNGANPVSGSVTASTTSTGELKLDWTLTGLEASEEGGIHVHYGTTCDSEATVKGDAPAGANKGHYYVPTSSVAISSEDPWATTKWGSDAVGTDTGSVTIPGSGSPSLGAAAATAYDRVVIVHNAAGKKVGCGVLSSSNTVTGSVTASTTSTGELKLDWTLTGLEASKLGGIHVHYG